MPRTSIRLQTTRLCAESPSGRCHRSSSAYRFHAHPDQGAQVAGVQARLRHEHQRKYPDISAAVWYDVAPIFPGVTQRMVNMAGDRLTRLSTPRGFVILRADHLEFRPVSTETSRASAGGAS